MNSPNRSRLAQPNLININKIKIAKSKKKCMKMTANLTATYQEQWAQLLGWKNNQGKEIPNRTLLGLQKQIRVLMSPSNCHLRDQARQLTHSIKPANMKPKNRVRTLPKWCTNRPTLNSFNMISPKPVMEQHQKKRKWIILKTI